MTKKQFAISQIFLSKLEKRSNFQKFQYLYGPFIYLLLNFMFVYLLGLNFNSSFIVFITILFTTNLSLPYLAKKAYENLNRIVIEIIIHENILKFKTLKYKCEIPQNEIRLIPQNITVLRKDHNALVFAFEGKSYHIISDYFDSEIKTLLTQERLDV